MYNNCYINKYIYTFYILINYKITNNIDIKSITILMKNNYNLSTEEELFDIIFFKTYKS